MRKMTRYIVWLTFSLALLSACQRQVESGSEEPEVPSGPAASVIPYSCTVSEGGNTKATLDDGGKYTFETGDRLFVRCDVEDELKMYGVLALDHIVDEGHFAVFSGDLTCLDNFTPAQDTRLSVTLLSNNDQIHAIDLENSQLLQSSCSYTGLSDPFAATLAQAVQLYSDFKATGYYIDKAFTLYQQSVFLQFSLTFDPEVGAGTSKTITLEDAAGNALNSASLSTSDVSGNGDIQINFVTALPAGTNIRGYKLAVSDLLSPLVISPNADFLLTANNYYTVARSLVETNAFTITAEEAETTITLGYTSGIQYSTDNGFSWWDYSGAGIVLEEAGEQVNLRGTRSDYSSARLFSSDKPCRISGELRSLLMQSGYTSYQSTVSANAFKQAFKDNTAIIGGSLTLPNMPLGDSCYEEMFSGCTGLTSCPVSSLPATSLPRYSYKNMFSGCSNMVSGLEFAGVTSVAEQSCYGMFDGCTALTGVSGTISAGTVGNASFQQMFKNCSALTAVPSFGAISSIEVNGCREMFYGCSSLASVTFAPISATSLPATCFYGMFQGCSSLASVGELSLASVTEFSGGGACQQMFYGCSALTAAPALPSATTLASSCYQSMFYGCTALVTAPALPSATTLASSCYQSMFYSCTALVTGPVLGSADNPVISVGVNSCLQMFQYCNMLKTVNGCITGTVSKQGMHQMFNECKALTTAPTLGTADAPITSVGEQSCAQMFRYCTKLTKVDGVFRLSSGSAKASFQEMFSMSSKAGEEGNGNYQNNVLASVPDFGDFTSVAENSCYAMFIGCKELTEVHIKLSDGDLEGASNCYTRMFDGCYKLERFTGDQYACLELPATVLSLECYRGMFRNCRALKSGPALPAETLTVRCYNKMFDGCTGLTTAPTIEAITLADGCCSIMFWGCTSLTNAPVLKAEELVANCYKQMFERCSNLNSITCLATSGIDVSKSTENWVKDVSASGTFTYATGTWPTGTAGVTWPTGNNGIPTGWTVRDYTP